MDTLQHFSEMLGIQHLDVPHLRGRLARRNNGCDDEPEHEPVERGRAEEEVGAGGKSGKVKKDRADQKKKARTRTWADVVKGKKKGESEIADSSKIEDESETVDSVEKFDSGEPNQMKAKRTRG